MFSTPLDIARTLQAINTTEKTQSLQTVGAVFRQKRAVQVQALEIVRGAWYYRPAQASALLRSLDLSPGITEDVVHRFTPSSILAASSCVISSSISSASTLGTVAAIHT